MNKIRLRVLPAVLPIDARQVEFQIGNGFLQWRYIGDDDWMNLISVDDLTPDLTVISTITLAPGQDATVILTPNADGYDLAFGIPRGEGFYNKLEYSAIIAYSKDDVVQYNGSSWIALQPTLGQSPPTLPTTSDANWSLLARAGADGAGTVATIIEGAGIDVDLTTPTAPIIKAVAFTGDAGAGGALGSVPAPATGDAAAGKVLGAGGSWVSPLAGAAPPSGRPTLSSSVVVPESDIVGVSNVYYLPCTGQTVPIFDGTTFVAKNFGAGLTLALDANSGHTNYHQAGKLYDLWTFLDGSTLRFGTGPKWDNGAGAGSLNARGTGAGSTELESFGGFQVNKNSMVIRWGSASGNTVTVAARQATYQGMFRASADGLATDSSEMRWLDPAYNQTLRHFRRFTTVGHWDWSTASYHQANADAANCISWVSGLAGKSIEATLHGLGSTSGATSRGMTVALGLDSTTTPAADCMMDYMTTISPELTPIKARYAGCPGLGFHQLNWLERGGGADIQTFFGDSGVSPSIYRLGIIGTALL